MRNASNNGGVSYFYRMQTFLEETLISILKKHSDVSALTFILPSKQTCGFLRNYLRKNIDKTIFAPKIISIEEFVEELSDLKIIKPSELLFKSYDVYLNLDSIEEKDDFETYTTWISTLLSDFNEIDRYLIDPKPFFSYLSSIQDINHWYLKGEKSALIENYLNFWNCLYEFYENLKFKLHNEKIGYQGLVYRKAVEDIEHYCRTNGAKKHIFIGFNALNNAEQYIIQELLETQNTSIYWDNDAHFYNDSKHSASLFIRKYEQDWKYFQSNPIEFIGNHFQAEKNIQFIEVQKNIGQAKYVGEIISTLTPEELNNTAIVLADKGLLIPILHSLPKNVSSVNITMGVELKTFPATSFFDLLLAFHSLPRESIYYKEVLTILNHPLAYTLIPNNQKIIASINRENISHLSLELIHKLSDKENESMIDLFFGDWECNTNKALNNCILLLNKAKELTSENPVDLTVLNKLIGVLSKIEVLNNTYSHIKNIKTIHSLYSELATSSTLDFKGDAYNGLQIMGILETRVLDFENIIITSVNEGVLPAGKSNASYITSDLKKQFGLPQYSEKDAMYTYHFYHLLHRSKNIKLLYNNHSEGLNSGEKSRFLLQLDIENHPNLTIEKIVLSPSVKIEQRKLKSIVKTDSVMERLQEIAGHGFSPSALTSYIRNPMDFYFQKVLKINEVEEVEETVAANTLGTIVHDTLEAFYKPIEGSFLTSEALVKMKGEIALEVTKQFNTTFKGGTFHKGKNLIIFEVVKRYVSNFINFELEELKAGNKIKIIQIETKLEVPIPIKELDFPVKLRGIVDRVDEYNGQLRIIDYKTGKIQQGDLEIINWEDISLDYKYSKAFQVLAYALMINKEIPITNSEAGIISFKNLNSGFLKFAIKEKTGSRTKQFGVNQESLANYSLELKKIIREICDPTTPFLEKDIDNDY